MDRLHLINRHDKFYAHTHGEQNIVNVCIDKTPTCIYAHYTDCAEFLLQLYMTSAPKGVLYADQVGKTFEHEP